LNLEPLVADILLTPTQGRVSNVCADSLAAGGGEVLVLEFLVSLSASRFMFEAFETTHLFQSLVNFSCVVVVLFPVEIACATVLRLLQTLASGSESHMHWCM
jgi:hypothetical protein